MTMKKLLNGVEVDMKPEEEQEVLDRRAKAVDERPFKKLSVIKEIRLRKLKETDYLSLNDLTLTDEMKEYRQGLRDIPQNNTTEAEYDLILARDEDENSITYKQLTNEIWSKP